MVVNRTRAERPRASTDRGGVGFLSRTPLVVVAALVAGALLVVPPSLGVGTRVVGAVAWALAIASVFEERRLVRRCLLASCGALSMLLFALDLAGWLSACAALVAVTILCTAVEPARVREVGLLGLGLGAGCPALLWSLIAVIGGSDSIALIRGELRSAIPGALELAVTGALMLAASGCALGVLSSANESRRATRSERALVTGFGVVVAAVLVARAVYLVSFATAPIEHAWSESPALLNLLKLRSGHEIYSSFTLASSYPYSPLLELLHHVLLGPFGLDLGLRANRALCLGYELGAAAIIAWALLPPLRATFGRAAALFVVLALGGVVLSSLLGPYIHPDHPLVLCLAAAVLLVVREASLPRRVFVALLVLVPPVATAFKLTGAGVGLGLVLVFGWRRRLRELGWLGVSAVLAIGTIPLFDLTLGHFSDWTIRLFASHPIMWGGLSDVLSTAEGSVAIAAAVLLGLARRYKKQSELVERATAVALLTLGVSATSLLAFLKYGGRTNSLLPLAIGAAVTLLLSIAALCQNEAGARVRPLFGAALAALLVLFTCKPQRPLVGEPRRFLAEAEALQVRALHDAFSAGLRPLLYTSTLAWIEAGRRDVPQDRAQAACELYVGGRPEIARHFERLERGDYDVIVMTTAAFSADGSVAGRFGQKLRDTILPHYELVEPRDAAGRPSWPQGNEGVVVLRRRPELTRAAVLGP